jgi:two-component system, cell cycle sensor histidine kinase and response regulator CckA
VYGLIGQSGGTITVESTVGIGSTFTILLPKVDVGFDQQLEAPTAQAPDMGVGVVLMVEDEPTVRQFARRVLEQAGHTLLTAGSGDEALRTAAAWPGSIDVLLTDIVMPGIHGQTLAARLQRMRPDVRVIFMSGYGEDAIPAMDRLATPAAFLAKPFSAATLDQAVAREIALVRVLREQ